MSGIRPAPLSYKKTPDTGFIPVMDFNKTDFGILVSCVIVSTIALVLAGLSDAWQTEILKDFLLSLSAVGITLALTRAAQRSSQASIERSHTDELAKFGEQAAEKLLLVKAQLERTSQKIYSRFPDSERDAEVRSYADALRNIAEFTEGAVRDWEKQLDKKISWREELTAAREQLESLKHDASEGVRLGGPTAKAALAAISEGLAEVQSKLGEEAIEKLTIGCPVCNKALTARLGTASGRTSHTTCSGCRSRLIIHRGNDGAFTAKVHSLTPVNTQALPDRPDLVCPTCLDSRAGTLMYGKWPVFRYCFKCDLRIHADTPAALTSPATSQATPTLVALEEMEGSWSLVCTCGWKLFLRTKDPARLQNIRGWCFKCRTYLSAVTPESKTKAQII